MGSNTFSSDLYGIMVMKVEIIMMDVVTVEIIGIDVGMIENKVKFLVAFYSVKIM